MLIVTNGDSAAAALRTAGIGAEILLWRDVLHDGPVPSGLSLEELSAVRASFLASRGWGAEEELAAEFRARDSSLASFRGFGEVVLWFEHDLYDQLQLLQLLDWFGGRDPGGTRLSLLCRAELIPCVDVAELPGRLAAREPVGEERLALAREAWSAFRSPDPPRLAAIARRGTPALPHLAPALQRLLEELPHAGTGLSRTERQILRAVDAGARTPLEAFRASAAMEEAMYLGDGSFVHGLEALTRDARPPLSAEPAAAEGAVGRGPAGVGLWFRGASLALTGWSRQILDGSLDHVEANGIDRWLGGLHLLPGTVWRWDAGRREVIGP